jgi:hypothetical protein
MKKYHVLIFVKKKKEKDIRVSNSKKAYFFHPLSFNIYRRVQQGT